MLHSAITRVSEQQVCGRVVLLVIGRDLAAQAASDGLATPAERQAARVFGGYIRARLRRSLELLDGDEGRSRGPVLTQRTLAQSTAASAMAAAIGRQE